MEKATFGAGCFWGVEQAFRQLPGVVEAKSGFMGGSVDEPSYREVCAGHTGHAEVVEVSYDPEKVSYAELLETFWKEHDPTQLNRQGPDIGEQYRSVIFTYNAEQAQEAESSKTELEDKESLNGPVVTEVEEAGKFYEAEEYHQRYYEKMGYGLTK
jgi:peptide-methionine (S)-S-oxide reductase